MTPRQHGKSPARILFVHHASPGWVRGSTKCLIDIVAHLDRSRFEPIVWCNAPAIGDAAAAGATVCEAPDWSATGGRFSRPWIREAMALIRRHSIRLVQIDEFTQTSVMLPATRFFGVPLVVQMQRIPTAEERRWSLLHQADYVVGTSAVSTEGLLQDGYPKDRTALIYNSVDPGRLRAGDARGLRAELGIGADEIVVTVVASLIPRKAVDTAIRSFDLLCRRRSGCHLIICGTGPERDALEETTHALHVAHLTHFLGERSDVGAILRDATDILLSSSRAESFGLTLAEAGLFGVPSVASDLAAHREVLADGGAGVLVPADEVSAFGAALTRMAEDESARREYGRRIRDRVAACFLIDRCVAKFQTVYSGLLSRPRSAFGWLRGTRWSSTYSRWLRERLLGARQTSERLPWSNG